MDRHLRLEDDLSRRATRINLFYKSGDPPNAAVVKRFTYDFYIRIIKLICSKTRERKIDGWREKTGGKIINRPALKLTIPHYTILFSRVVLQLLFNYS